MTPTATSWRGTTSSWRGTSCRWRLLTPARLLSQRVQDVEQAVLCDTLVEQLVALQSAACVKSPGGAAKAAGLLKCPWHGT